MVLLEGVTSGANIDCAVQNFDTFGFLSGTHKGLLFSKDQAKMVAGYKPRV